MGIRTVLKALVVCLSIAACFSVAARADTYTYTGDAYSFCEGTFTCTGTAPQQTATITFKPGTQLDNLPLTDVTLDILSFSYTEGESSPLTVISTISPTLEIATDASGNITSWMLQASDIFFVGSDFTVRVLVSESIPGHVGDYSAISTQTTEGDGYSILPGTWSKSPVTTPEPGSGLLAAAAFVILAGIALGRRGRDLPVA